MFNNQISTIKGVKRSLFDDINKSPNRSDSSLTACTPNNSINGNYNFNF